jgi:hypothetical protein
MARRLDELGIEYAIAGGMALFSHGFRRFTEDVDIIVTKEGLAEIHKSLEGRGYRPPFEKSKNLRDTESGVRIEFLIAGQYPGDGKPKPVAFPTPGGVTVEKEGIRFLNLPKLVELKLASGMTSPERMKDLADVQELIRLFSLSPQFAENLDPFVQSKFLELRQNVLGIQKRYLLLLRSEHLSADELEAMQRDGVTIDTTRSGIANNTICLVTDDPEIARKYDMHEESEYLDLGEHDGVDGTSE